MAIWNYRFAIVPEAAPTLTGDQDRVEEALRGCNVWGDEHLDVNVFRKVAVPGESWSPEISVWKTHDGDRVSIIYDADRIEWISVSLDLRRNYGKFLADLVGLANEMKWKFLMDGRYRAAEVSSVQDAVCRSLAFRYVRDPRQALHELSRGRDA